MAAKKTTTKKPSLKSAKSATKKPGKVVTTKPNGNGKGTPLVTAAKKANGKKSSGSGGFSPTAKITLLVPKNPKREGTKAHAKFAKYKNGMTVQAFIDGGGRAFSLAWDVKRKYISVK